MNTNLVGTVWDSKDGKRAITIAEYDGSRFYRYTSLDGKNSRFIERAGLVRKYVRR